ncbi:MAG: dihydropteroate synthase [Verrucomicrobiales bacterium]|nr:dihydropteroate synthase [Verrucomicrobiales bacterium]
MNLAPWRIHGIDHSTTPRAWVMAIVNVTPDSFSDGGRFHDTGRAVEHSLRLAAEGADILDIGGESTRPGAAPVSTEEEIRRVIPVIHALRSQTPALLSVDTMKAAVARAALDAGADIINDVTGLSADPGMIPLAAERDCGLVVMHMQGEPRTMQHAPHYQDVTAEVRRYFERRLQLFADAGIDPSRVVLDPGFGFGKTLEHNLTLLRRLPELRVQNRPLLVGISRKSMIATITDASTMEERFWPTVALTAWLREQGATIHRVHDAAATRQALRMIEAILDPA